ncbi:MAG TPA: PhnD/SsuA/transferrin family substrate-binding protein [Conexibacter sp.]|jgi:ABC-type phosphate/phosphonate transport system substrate-binding protein
MSGRSEDLITVGAVAYHPRVVTIWERFRAWLTEAGAPTDYLLFSNYERLVEAVLEGEVDIGWHTNTAFVALERALGREAPILGMRDRDADFATVIVTRRGETFDDVEELAGRRLALGSRDSGHAAILPLYYLARQGLDAAADCQLVRFDTHLGKHGDTGDSELRVVEAVAEGTADAGALGDVTWATFRTQGLPVTGQLEIAWRSPTYYHCNFTALPSIDALRAARWQRALLAMDYDDPAVREAMTLEGVRRWLPGDRVGYTDLADAMAVAHDAERRGRPGAAARRARPAPTDAPEVGGDESAYE